MDKKKKSLINNKDGYSVVKGKIQPPVKSNQRLNDYMKLNMMFNSDTVNGFAKILMEVRKPPKTGSFYRDNERVGYLLNRISRKLETYESGKSKEFVRVYSKLVGGGNQLTDKDKKLLKPITIIDINGNEHTGNILEDLRELIDVYEFSFFNRQKDFWNVNGKRGTIAQNIPNVASAYVINYIENKKNREKLYDDDTEKYNACMDDKSFEYFVREILPCFRQYQKEQSIVDGSKKLYRLNFKGWKTVSKLLEGIEDYTPQKGIEVINQWWVNASKSNCGDVNVFLWISQHPELWKYVGDIIKYDKFVHKLGCDDNYLVKIDKRQKSVGFTYPDNHNIDLDGGTDSFIVSSTSSNNGGGNGLVWMNMCVPNEDVETLEKLGVFKSDINGFKLKENKKTVGVAGEMKAAPDYSNEFFTKQLDMSQYCMEDLEKLPEYMRGIFKDKRRLPIQADTLTKGWLLVPVYFERRYRDTTDIKYKHKTLTIKKDKNGGNPKETIYDRPFSEQILRFADEGKFIDNVLLRSAKIYSRNNEFFINFSVQIVDNEYADSDKACGDEITFFGNADSLFNKFNKHYMKRTDNKNKNDMIGTATGDFTLVGLDKGLNVPVYPILYNYNAETNNLEFIQRFPYEKNTVNFNKIQKVERSNKRKRQQTSKVIKNKYNADKVTLPKGHGRTIEKHLNNMRDEMQQQAVAHIRDVVKKGNASYVKAEDLPGFGMSKDNSKYKNKMHKDWAKAKFDTKLGNYDTIDGFVYHKVYAGYTSLFCHKCGHPVVRVNEECTIQYLGSYYWCSNDGCDMNYKLFEDLESADANFNATFNITRRGVGKEFISKEFACLVGKDNKQKRDEYWGELKELYKIKKNSIKNKIDNKGKVGNDKSS